MGGFSCSECKNLKSLKGAPKKVGNNFYCNECESLTSLEGAPKEVGGDFECYNCGREFDCEDVWKVSDVEGKIRLWDYDHNDYY